MGPCLALPLSIALGTWVGLTPGQEDQEEREKIRIVEDDRGVRASGYLVRLDHGCKWWSRATSLELSARPLFVAGQVCQCTSGCSAPLSRLLIACTPWQEQACSCSHPKSIIWIEDRRKACTTRCRYPSDRSAQVQASSVSRRLPGYASDPDRRTHLHTEKQVTFPLMRQTVLRQHIQATCQ